ncbi:hypothetical protein [Mycoplasma sp. HU2014]|uniref:hypothetical protein n=1 Tax=Mycoplasma sp. HU2014 TaxID=1664275 RepID=UPI00067BDA57|nr:hypothetical protein [Mycoplasma sp. HU2014]KNG79085.1 membrane protein [Mycoplasma sp. HU2014]
MNENKKILENFFIKNYNAKLLKSKVSSKISYLYNSSNKFQIVVINFDKNITADKELEYVIQKMQKAVNQTVQVFMIVVDQNANNDLIEHENKKILYSSIENLKDNLEPFFEKSDLLDFNQHQQQETKEELNEQNSFEENLKSLNKFIQSIKSNKITFSWIVLILLVLLPGSIQLFAPYLLKNSQISSNTLSLVFGATNWNLTILGGQWWRVFTYGFAPMQQIGSPFLSILILLILGSMFFNISKMCEISIGKTLSFATSSFLSYLVLGLFASCVLPATYTGGIISTIGIFLGILLTDSSGKNTPVAKFSQSKGWKYIIMLILFSLLFGNGLSSLLITGVGMVLGSCFIGLLKTEFRDWKWMEVIQVALIVSIITIPIVFIMITKFTTAVDPNILNALSFYIKNKWFSTEFVNSITNKIGWDGNFNAAGNWITGF